MSMRLSDLAGRPFNYEGVGNSEPGVWPPERHSVSVSREIGTGRGVFDRAADALMHWQAQKVLGVRLTATTDKVAIGSESLTRLGFGPLSMPAPCRVVWAIDEPDRVGYAYGTLEGHPAAGEESFMVSIVDDTVTFRVKAFSHPASRLAKLGGPATVLMQRFVATRYVAHLQRISN